VNLDNAELFAALAIFGVGGLWQAASLRGKVHGDWRERVSDTERQLTDRAVRELRSLQSDLVGLAAGDQSLPGLATFDPASVAGRAREFQRTLEARVRVQRSFSVLLGIGWPLIVGFAVFLAGIGMLFLDNSELLEGGGLRLAGAFLTGAGALDALIGLAAYIVASQALSGAEVHAFTPVQAGGDLDDD
jgi:hypothetical protein